jgi:hypothetical protein
MVGDSVFRPFEGQEPILCGNPDCRKLNPPKARFCWVCKTELPRPTREQAGRDFDEH